MRAVILAGGFGSRLKPVVSNVPKPLAPIVNDTCFLDILLKLLISSGFDRFIFCLHYKHELIEERYGNGRNFGVDIKYSVEDVPLGTGGAIGLLRNSVSEPFFVFNADTYLLLDYKSFASVHENKKALVSIALTYMDDPGRYGSVQLDDDMNVICFDEKQQSRQAGGYINAGVYLFEPEIFDFIPKNKSSMEIDVFPAVLNSKRIISGYSKTSDFIDIGIPDDYRRFIQYYSHGKIIG